MALKSIVAVVFAAAVFGNGMYCDESDMNACTMCHYLPHIRLGNVSPASNFSLKCGLDYKLL